jgi:hypothetical protein
MSGSWSPAEFPNLTDSTCKVTSPPARRYNCIAWAAGDDTQNWWPDPYNIGYWPQGVPREESIQAFMLAYESLGYKLCYGDHFEEGIEKIAIYGIENPDKTVTPTHAARLLSSGEWTSKLGNFEDIGHKTLEAVDGPVYGRKVCCMSRLAEQPSF